MRKAHRLGDTYSPRRRLGVGRLTFPQPSVGCGMRATQLRCVSQVHRPLGVVDRPLAEQESADHRKERPICLERAIQQVATEHLGDPLGARRRASRPPSWQVGGTPRVYATARAGAGCVRVSRWGEHVCAHRAVVRSLRRQSARSVQETGWRPRPPSASRRAHGQRRLPAARSQPDSGGAHACAPPRLHTHVDCAHTGWRTRKRPRGSVRASSSERHTQRVHRRAAKVATHWAFQTNQPTDRQTGSSLARCKLKVARTCDEDARRVVQVGHPAQSRRKSAVVPGRAGSCSQRPHTAHSHACGAAKLLVGMATLPRDSQRCRRGGSRGTRT